MVECLCLVNRIALVLEVEICTDLFGMIRLEPTNLSADGMFSQLRDFLLAKIYL